MLLTVWLALVSEESIPWSPISCFTTIWLNKNFIFINSLTGGDGGLLVGLQVPCITTCTSSPSCCLSVPLGDYLLLSSLWSSYDLWSWISCPSWLPLLPGNCQLCDWGLKSSMLKCDVFYFIMFVTCDMRLKRLWDWKWRPPQKGKEFQKYDTSLKNNCEVFLKWKAALKSVKKKRRF